MEKAANGYEYENTDVNSNDLNNKPLTMESRNEGQGGGNDVDLFNKGVDDNSNSDNGIDSDNGLTNNNTINSNVIEHEEQNNVINSEEDIQYDKEIANEANKLYNIGNETENYWHSY